MKEQILTILVSTVDKKILSNEELLSLKLTNTLEMIVVNQMIRDKSPLVLNKDHCFVINDDDQGLSRSRNLALKKVKSGIAIIADDDISYVKNFDSIIRSSFTKNKECAILTFKIKSLQNIPYKKYKEEAFFHNRTSILKVSSISICLNIDKLKPFNIYFDEQFGLGSRYTSGEENIFLADVLDAKQKIRFIPRTIVIHELESSGKNFNEQTFISKGALFSKLYGTIGILVSIAFLIRKRHLFSKKITFYRALKYIFKGYCSFSRFSNV